MSRTNRIILICVETTKGAKTDSIYVDKALKTLYDIDNETKIEYEYLMSKTKYNDKGIKRKIERKIKDFSEATIVYCLDSDDIFVNPETAVLNKRIEEYCKLEGYRIVWFCRDIEEVFLHRRVGSTDKLSEAAKFNARKGIGVATAELLGRMNITKEKTSNFTCVFDKLFAKKQSK